MTEGNCIGTCKLYEAPVLQNSVHLMEITEMSLQIPNPFVHHCDSALICTAVFCIPPPGSSPVL